MTGTLLSDRLARTTQLIAEGERRIAKQRWIVVVLEQDGLDARLARDLLVQFETALAIHCVCHERIAKELMPARPRA
jgi:hypothetical protein